MIFVECKPDEILVRRLTGLPKKQVVHAFNKSELCKQLGSNNNVLGVVDEDPNSPVPDYLSKLENSGDDDYQHLGLRLLSDEARHNSVIIICPRLEEWVLRASSDSDLVLANYGLPNRAEALHKIINVDLRKFERLLDDLLDSNNIRVNRLTQLLSIQ